MQRHGTGRREQQQCEVQVEGQPEEETGEERVLLWRGVRGISGEVRPDSGGNRNQQLALRQQFVDAH